MRCEERFAAILADFKLPGLNGLELVKQIRAANRRVPIILMTAHGTAELAIEATRWGAYDYLLKPFEMPALLAMIENAVQHTILLKMEPRGDAVAMGREVLPRGTPMVVTRSRVLRHRASKKAKTGEANGKRASASAPKAQERPLLEAAKRGARDMQRRAGVHPYL